MKIAVYISPLPILLGILFEGEVERDRTSPSLVRGLVTVVETVGTKLGVVVTASLSSELRKARDSKTVLAKVLGS